MRKSPFSLPAGSWEPASWLSARWRGHSLRWQTFNPDSALGICRCGMQVLVLRKPSPNQIDIGGEAVAVSCPLKAA